MLVIFLVKREEFFRRAREGVRTALLRRDNVLVQTVSAIDEINKSANLLLERLQEWYGVYFPELRIEDSNKYCKVVVLFEKGKTRAEELEQIVGRDKAMRIVEMAGKTIGVDLSEKDLLRIKSLANEIIGLYALRDALEVYQEEIARELCPNLSHLAGPAIAAKVVACAGDLQRLGRMPASTIQVLGAEKALFKHLRTGTKPPKHGVIFQHPDIGKSRRDVRGKIARALSTKMAIAARADAISKRFIAGKLKEDYDKKVKKILGG